MIDLDPPAGETPVADASPPATERVQSSRTAGSTARCDATHAQHAGRRGTGSRRSRPAPGRIAAGRRDRLPHPSLAVARGAVRRRPDRPCAAHRRRLTRARSEVARPRRLDREHGGAGHAPIRSERRRAAGDRPRVDTVDADELVKALRIAHVLAWEEPVGRPKRLPRDAAICSAAIAALIATETLVTYLRHHDRAPSRLLILASYAISGGCWLASRGCCPIPTRTGERSYPAPRCSRSATPYCTSRRSATSRRN
jgi:hypothetical protein